MRRLRLALAVLLMFAACSQKPGVDVRLDEYSVGTNKASVASGRTVFRVENDGDVPHEFIVIRTDRPADRLPTEHGVIQTDASGLSLVKEVDRVAPGGRARVVTALTAGHYVLVCNIAGHYAAGMRKALRVT